MDFPPVNVPGNGQLHARLVTSLGDIVVRLEENRVPNTVRNFVGLAIPRSVSISHSRLRRSVKRTIRPGSPFGTCPLAFARCAHSAWREPGPWQASQDTSISEKVVWKRSSARR